MATTELTPAQKQEIVEECINQIKASSQSVSSLAEADSLDGVSSLPAIQGTVLVRVPLSMLTALTDAARIAANTAAASANNAAKSANTATASVNNATESANTAAAAANTATANADEATAAAQAATTAANNAATAATTAKGNADTATANANAAAQAATTAKTNAETATANANAATTAAQQAKTDAETATAAAEEATEAAEAATEQALMLVGKIVPTSLTVEEVGRLTKGNVQPVYINATLTPSQVMKNLIYISDNKAVTVSPDGRLTIVGTGRSTIQVIPTVNTALAKVIQVEVGEPTLRLNTLSSLRFTSSGGLRLN